jgi:6-phosphofructokinase
MGCDIREPYILKAMGRACSHVAASKGHIRQDERDDIADRIVAKASTGETSIDKLVEFAVGPEAELRAVLE